MPPKQLEARRQILGAANAVRDAHLRPLRMRHLHTAVCIVRRRQLVKPAVLLAAGFNAKAAA